MCLVGWFWDSISTPGWPRIPSSSGCPRSQSSHPVPSVGSGVSHHAWLLCGFHMRTESPMRRRAGQVTVFVPLLQCGRLSCCSPTTCALLVSTEIILFAREINWRSVCDLVLQEYVFLKGVFRKKLRFHFEVPRIGTTTSHMWDKPLSYIPNSYLYLEMEPC